VSRDDAASERTSRAHGRHRGRSGAPGGRSGAELLSRRCVRVVSSNGARASERRARERETTAGETRAGEDLDRVERVTDGRVSSSFRVERSR